MGSHARYLKIVRGGKTGILEETRFALPETFEGYYVIGRSQKSDLQLFDPAVSKTHAAITQSRGVFGMKYHVMDLGSTNGTRVNGKRFGEAKRLRVGSVIGLGETEIAFTDRVTEYVG